ncbi:MAG: alcohol dehydrogenase catalytic domain-containing protein, partial [Gammaproteobacteria bacterium]|nr:alcohol dehydrogenase catalytic domain-containing protein [Gammaproteobacteria bacterium]
MKSYAIREFGTALAELETPTPVPQGTEVLLEVRHCGVCHTDLHLREGSFDLGGGKRLASRLALPHVPGHEIEGSVVAAGPAAAGVRIGARYAAFPWIGCGSCDTCRRGEENICLGETRQLGCSSGCPGGYATHVLVPHPRYLINYGTVEPALSAACMCSGLTAYSALRKTGRIESDDAHILLIGCGGVGMMAIQFARALFAGAPRVADIDAGRRQAALAAGAAAAYDAADAGTPERIRADTGAGPAAVVDFVGSEQSFALANRVVRRGGRIVVVGLFGGALQLPLPLIPLRQISIIGSNTGTLAETHEMMALVRAGRVHPIPITRRPLAQAESALSTLG